MGKGYVWRAARGTKKQPSCQGYGKGQPEGDGTGVGCRRQPGGRLVASFGKNHLRSEVWLSFSASCSSSQPLEGRQVVHPSARVFHLALNLSNWIISRWEFFQCLGSVSPIVYGMMLGGRESSCLFFSPVAAAPILKSFMSFKTSRNQYFRHQRLLCSYIPLMLTLLSMKLALLIASDTDQPMFEKITHCFKI